MTRRIKNTLVLGKIGSGKTTLTSLLTNPLNRQEDRSHFLCYCLDPEFTNVNVRDDSRGYTFIDTHGLTGRSGDYEYLRGLKSALPEEHYEITGIIICLIFQRIKLIDACVIRAILQVFPPDEYNIAFCINGTSGANINICTLLTQFIPSQKFKAFFIMI